MKKNKKIIERRMMTEKKWITYVIVVIVFISFAWTFFSLIFLGAKIKEWSQFAIGLDQIDTKEKIEKFYNSKYKSAILHFNFAIDTEEEIYIETTTKKETSLLGATGGIVIGGPETSEIEYYHVYILGCDETTIVLCSKIKDLDLSTGKIMIYNEYSGSYVNEEIREQYDESGNGYIFYVKSNGQTKTFSIVNEILFILKGYIIFFLILIIIRNLKFIHKRTKLGKRIKELGDFDTMVKELDNQIEHSIYTYGNAIVTEEYVLILKQVDTDVLKIKEIANLEIIPDEKYPEEIIRIEFKSNDEVYNFNVYSKEDAEKIKQHITNKAGN